MFKRLCLLSVAFACMLLTACVNQTTQSVLPKMSSITSHIELNKTTFTDCRKKFGTPTYIGIARADSKKIAGYAINTSVFKNFGANLGKGLLTFGFGTASYPITVKNLLLKFDENDVVIDVKVNGLSKVGKTKSSTASKWDEALRFLNPDEIESNTDYSDEEIHAKYNEEYAASKGIAVNELTKDEIHKKFAPCNIYCLSIKGALKAFGDFDYIEQNPKVLPIDGTESVFK